MLPDQEPQKTSTSVLTPVAEDDWTGETDTSPERKETLRRANEALERAKHWAEWMEALQDTEGSQGYDIPARSQAAPFGLVSVRRY